MTSINSGPNITIYFGVPSVCSPSLVLVRCSNSEAATEMSTSGGVEVKRAFIGAGCNRIVNNVSWGASDFLAFGSQNAVVIFSPKVLLFFSFFNLTISYYHSSYFLFLFSFFNCRLLRFWLHFRVTRLLSTAPTGFLVLNLLSKVPSFFSFLFFPGHSLFYNFVHFLSCCLIFFLIKK